MFWNIFLELCNKKRMKPTKVVCELGISRGSITNWKKGSMPNDSTLLKIANYFGVSMAYLKGDEKGPAQVGAWECKEEVFNRNGAGADVELTPAKQLLLELGITSEGDIVCLDNNEYLRVRLKDEYRDLFKVIIKNSEREKL